MKSKYLYLIPILLLGLIPILLGLSDLSIYTTVGLVCLLALIWYINDRLLKPIQTIEHVLEQIVEGKQPKIPSLKAPWTVIGKKLQYIVVFLRINTQGAEDKIFKIEEQNLEIKKQKMMVGEAHQALQQINSAHDKLRGVTDVQALLLTTMEISVSITSAQRGFFLKFDLERPQAEVVATCGPTQLKTEEVLKTEPLNKYLQDKANLVIRLTATEQSGLLYGESYRSALLGLVIIDNEIWGMMCLLDKEMRNGITEFLENDETLLENRSTILAIEWKSTHLFEQATIDGLSRLYVRRYFEKRMEEELLRSKRNGEPVSLLMVDIDHFKQFNDTYGHRIGDEVIKLVASILKNSVREIDFVGRYGGEEMVVLLPGTNLEGSKIVAERIRQRIAESRIPCLSDQMNVTISIGIATFPIHGLNKDQLLQFADEGLYKAKNSGRNRVCVMAG